MVQYSFDFTTNFGRNPNGSYNSMPEYMENKCPKCGVDLVAQDTSLLERRCTICGGIYHFDYDGNSLD